MSWSEMQKMGYAKIIVDTSTMTVGDKVRVKSVYKPTQYMDKQVVTVGTPIIFDLGFLKDYVKICMVQTINDVETEIGGVYKTVDFGQTLFIDNALDKSTLRGIQSILNSHSELQALNIGDEVEVNINGGTKWTMQVGAIDLYNSHEVILISKDLWSQEKWYTDNTTECNYNSYLKAKVDAFYTTIVESEKTYIKNRTKSVHKSSHSAGWVESTSKIWLPNRAELFGTSYYPSSTTPPIAQKQIPLFITQANRVKNYVGQASSVIWWTCDGWLSPSGYAMNSHYSSASGTDGYMGNSNGAGVCPCFWLLADS